ncbi:hypothetical protein Tco_0902950, partial [Tanacetum coccineum]
GGPTSLGSTGEEGVHPQLSSGHDASTDSTAEADSGLSAPNDSIPSQQYLLKDTRSALFAPDSPQDEAIIISDESEEEEEVDKDKDTHATSHDLLASHDFASCLPTELKDLPSKFTELSRETKELKKHVKDMKTELPGDLKEIPKKLENFTSTISSLTSQVVELKNIQWELPVKFLDLPSQVSSVQEKLKTLDSLPSLLNKVTDTLNRFTTVVEGASGVSRNNVPSIGKATALHTDGEKNTNPATTDAEPNLHDELVNLLGIDVVTYDLHLAEWREVVQACPSRKEKGWKTIYGLIKTRIGYLDQTEKELKIDFNKPLKEQDPMNELNDLVDKKRKRTENKFEEDNTPIVIQPPCYSASKIQPDMSLSEEPESILDRWNGWKSKKKTKNEAKSTNRTRNGKAGKDKSITIHTLAGIVRVFIPQNVLLASVGLENKWQACDEVHLPWDKRGEEGRREIYVAEVV